MDAATQTDLSWIVEQVIVVEETPLVTEQDQESTDDTTDEAETEMCNLQELVTTMPLSIEDDEEEEETYTTISSTVNLPWPAILQYMRETDSASSKYFSLTKHHTIEAKEGEENDTELCQFCNQTLKHLSLLPDSLDKEPVFCCDDMKEYVVLVALYTKRLQEQKLNSRPGQIRIESQWREIEKKTAQERALERMRRKQKWEEKCRELKVLQSSSVSAMSRQTKVIKFSLSLENCMSTGWVTDITENKGKKKVKRQPLPVILPSLAIDDEAVITEGTSTAGYIEETCYSTGNHLSLMLPDNTGQIYYPSNNLAILQASLHQSVNMYLIFEDSMRMNLIGYIDDYGRGWVKGDAHNSISFLSTLHECFIFDNSGRSKMWVWSDTGTYSLHLPLIFKLNQHLTIRYNNHDDIHISLVAQQKQHKIQIKRIFTMGGADKPPIDKITKHYKSELEKMKYRFNSHMRCFQQSIKVYNSSSERNRVLPPIASNSRKLYKRSTIGTVTFQQQQ